MRELKNPMNKHEGYQCFGCASHNENGLQMKFYEDGDEIVSIWTPKEHFQGWIDVLHGGIQSTMMDEIASWVVFVKCKTAGVTSRMDIKLKKTVFVNAGNITLRAKLKEMKRNIAVIDVKLYNADDEVCAIAEIQYFTYPIEVAKEMLYYPGADAF